MKVDIYVQKDGSALVVPAGTAISSLSHEGQKLVQQAVQSVKTRDIDESIIGLDRKAAKKGLAESGEHVSDRK